VSDPAPELAPGAQAILKGAEEIRQQNDQAEPGLHYYLTVFLQRHGPMAEDLSGLDAKDLLRDVDKRVAAGDAGPVVPPDDLVALAYKRAKARGASLVSERDLGSTLLVKAGFELVKTPESASTKPVGDTAARSAARPDGSPAPDPGGVPLRAHRKTPLLDELGRDLTKAAADGKLSPLVGREQEVRTAITTLCRVTKRNPVLLGPAGVGKTAIVEGLAQKVVAGDVPDCLQGIRLIEIKVGSLVSGAGIVGKLEERMTQLLAEASGPDVVLFIDEIHSILGSGSGGHGMDVGGLLKPALARDQLALVGATTDMEYKRIVDQDAALERRFQPVYVSEMTKAQALDVLRVQRDRFVESRGVAVSDEILEWLVAFADSFLRNRHFPDKAIDLLEQCVAHAMVERRSELDLETCKGVAQQLIGMPLGIDERLERLRERLEAIALLPKDDADELLARLQLTMSAHDFAPERPNAILLLTGDTAAHADVLAGVLSEALFGSAQRVVEIDLAGYMDQDQSALTRLLGMPYGYVGAELSRGAVQQLNGQPWSTVLIRNIDQCGRLYLDLVTEALRSGHFTDAHGTAQYLSDTVVILTAGGVGAREGRPLGFVQTSGVPGEHAAERLAETSLGPGVTALCQVVGQAASAESVQSRYLTNVALPGVTERYARDGLIIEWDPSVVVWLSGIASQSQRPDEWSDQLEQLMSPVLVRLFKDRPDLPVVVSYEGGELKSTVPGSSG